MNDLHALLAQVKAATGPDRELDRDIAVACGLGNVSQFGVEYIEEDRCHEIVPALTSSIDAALALCERVLPGWVVSDLCQNSRLAGDPWGCTLAIYYGSTPSKNRSASSGYDFQRAPLAILSALLLALISKAQEHDQQ